MKKVSFGWAQLCERTPQAIKLLRSGSAKASLIIVALQLFYPQYISKEFVAEVSTASLAIAAIAPYFGVKQDDKDNGTTTV